MRAPGRLGTARGALGLAVVVVAIASLMAACGGSSGKGGGSSSTTAAAAKTTGVGVGVTPTDVKVGIALVDFNCVKQFVDTIRLDQDKVYQSFIDDINAKGGIAGRKIVPVYDSYCPIGNAGALSVCTKLTEDDKVFAVMGNLFDSSGDAQTCVAKQHDRVLLTFNMTQPIIDRSPPGLIIYPGATNERTVQVVLQLLQKQGTLKGKRVAAMGATQEASTVNQVIVPGLRRIGAIPATPAVLSISGSDTTAALAQLDSFIERWKGEHVDAVFLSGDEVSSSQFVTKLKGAMPNVQLYVDTTDVKSPAQDAVKAHENPNPYEGIISTGGPTPVEYDHSAHWAYCAAIYEKYTGKHAPSAEEVVPGPGGKTLDTNGSINDACQILSLFHDIAARVGPNLNNANWVSTVNTFGHVDNKGGGQYASLRTGKYDIEDTFRLEAWDSTIPAIGDWRAVTPLENIPG